MNENIIKFRKQKPTKQHRQLSPGLRRLLAIVGITLFFVGAWAYFQYLA